MLDVREVSKYYPRPEGLVTALEGVSLRLAAGEMLAVMGPSGCGKTTLLLAMGTLLAPDEGEVLVDGENPYGLSAEARSRLRAKKIGFVFQQFYLVPYLNVFDNVLVPSLALDDRKVHDRAWGLIERFNLVARARHVPGELSTGERQRVALARALLNRPKLLLADEPTGNLDSANAEVVLEALAEFAREGGAVAVVTHGEEAGRFAHRVVQLEHGQLQGT